MVLSKTGGETRMPNFSIFIYYAVKLPAISMKENDNIRCIIVEGTEIKIIQLADDTSCFVMDLSSIAEILSIFKDFQQSNIYWISEKGPGVSI